MMQSKLSIFNKYQIILFLVAVFQSSSTLSDEWFADNQIHGFASQGWIKTANNNFFGPSSQSGGSLEFTEIGLVGSTQVTHRVRAAGQVLYRVAGGAYPGEVNIDFAHVDWDIYISPTNTTTLMLGRIKNPFGLYNETRDVAFTRPGIFVPQVVYFDRVRNAILSGDGFHVNSRYISSVGYFDLRLGAVYIPLDENVTQTFMGGNFGGSFKTENPALIGRISYENLDSSLRLGFSYIDYSFNYQAPENSLFQNGTLNGQYWILSAQYNAEKWSLTGEYMNEPLSREGFGQPILDEFNHTVEGWFVQLDYRSTDNWEHFVRYEQGYLDKDNPSGDNWGPSLNTTNHGFFHKSIVVGTRWDITSQWMLRAEFHMINGTMILSNQDNNITDTEQYWNMFALEAAYRF